VFYEKTGQGRSSEETSNTKEGMRHHPNMKLNSIIGPVFV